MVYEQLISFIKKMVNGITIPPNYKQDEITNMCIKLVLKDVIV